MSFIIILSKPVLLNGQSAPSSTAGLILLILIFVVVPRLVYHNTKQRTSQKLADFLKKVSFNEKVFEDADFSAAYCKLAAIVNYKDIQYVESSKDSKDNKEVRADDRDLFI